MLLLAVIILTETTLEKNASGFEKYALFQFKRLKFTLDLATHSNKRVTSA
jgi:hypothetical protein